MLSAPSRHQLKGSHYHQGNMKTPFARHSAGKKKKEKEEKNEYGRDGRRGKKSPMACQAETRLRHIAWDLIGHRRAVKKHSPHRGLKCGISLFSTWGPKAAHQLCLKSRGLMSRWLTHAPPPPFPPTHSQ